MKRLRILDLAFCILLHPTRPLNMASDPPSRAPPGARLAATVTVVRAPNRDDSQN